MKNKNLNISEFSFLEKISDNLKIKFYSFVTTPLLAKISPRVEHFNHSMAIVSVPLKRSTKNIYKSMYFGAINMGAELCVFYIIHKLTKNLKFCRVISKNYSINFIKKPKGRVYFRCDEVKEIKKMLNDAIETKKKMSGPIKGYGYVLENGKEQRTCEFTLTIHCNVKASIG